MADEEKEETASSKISFICEKCMENPEKPESHEIGVQTELLETSDDSDIEILRSPK